MAMEEGWKMLYICTFYGNDFYLSNATLSMDITLPGLVKMQGEMRKKIPTLCSYIGIGCLYFCALNAI